MTRLKYLFIIFAIIPCMAFAQEINTGLQLPIAACLQYQRVKETRGSTVAPFRRYGFHPFQYKDSTKRIWGYHVMPDSAYKKSQPLYRMFRRHDIRSFAIIDDASKQGSCQYVFWWKGYYRQFVADLRRMGFSMSNVPNKTNVLRFSRPDINIIVEFLIWEDIYVMTTSSKQG